MPYFTSWDANVFLCLLSVFPEEVVRGMIKDVKKTHEGHVQKESMKYWRSLTGRPLSNDCFRRQENISIEFKDMWRWRCPEKRRKFVTKWTMEGPVGCLRIADPNIDKGEGTSKTGYWNSGEAWSYSIKDRELDTSEWSEDEEKEYFDMKDRNRREYVTEWYENIHEGRYFLFFKENDIFSDNLYTKEKLNMKSICDMGCRAQVAQDLLTIDGPGIGEPSGNHIEHIDDIFL